MINIDQLINDATKQRSPSINVYRLMKAEFLRWMKDNPGKNFDEAVEQKILKKMCDQRQDALKQYTDAGRADLAEIEAKEIEILKPFLPKEVSPKEIEDYTTEICDKLRDGGYNITMKDMKSILSQVQEKYPGANGTLVSKIVKYYC